MRRLRAAIPSDERAARSRSVAEGILSLPEIGASRTALLFYAFGSEVETRGMVAGMAARGVRVLLPYLGSGGMEAAPVDPGEALTPTSYGPKEPRRRVAVDPSEVDLVVAPGLAFDRRGHRLGFGGGHYDRYLARLSTEALRIGVGFAEQLVEEIPAEEHDQRVHLVVTDAGIVDCR